MVKIINTSNKMVIINKMSRKIIIILKIMAAVILQAAGIAQADIPQAVTAQAVTIDRSAIAIIKADTNNAIIITKTADKETTNNVIIDPKAVILQAADIAQA